MSIQNKFIVDMPLRCYDSYFKIIGQSCSQDFKSRGSGGVFLEQDVPPSYLILTLGTGMSHHPILTLGTGTSPLEHWDANRMVLF